MTTPNHRTPLHCAASCNNQSLCRLLIEGGACLFAVTETENETCLDKCDGDNDDDDDDDEDDVDGKKKLKECSAYLKGCFLFPLPPSHCIPSSPSLSTPPTEVADEMQTEGTKLYAAYDYNGDSADEVSMETGDVLTFLKKEPSEGEGWYYCRHLKSGLEGLVPRNYLGVSFSFIGQNY